MSCARLFDELARRWDTTENGTEFTALGSHGMHRTGSLWAHWVQDYGDIIHVIFVANALSSKMSRSYSCAMPCHTTLVVKPVYIV